MGYKAKKPRSAAYRKKMSQIKMGHPVSEETKKKIVAVRMANGSYKHSEESKAKIKASRMNNPIRNWKGGINSVPGYRSWVKNKRNRVIKRLKEEGECHSFGEWETLKAQYNWTCPCCKKSEPEIKLTEDHIIPLSRGGSDRIENIQPLCKSCNCKKHAKIIKY